VLTLVAHQQATEDDGGRMWCATQEAALAWVTLDAGDNDPSQMWTYVATAVDRIRAGLGQPALRRLGVGGSQTEAAVDELMNALGRYGEPVILVLDDLHAITDLDCLATIDHAPPRAGERARDRQHADRPPPGSGAGAERPSCASDRLHLAEAHALLVGHGLEFSDGDRLLVAHGKGRASSARPQAPAAIVR
jgi:hypothetical protein